MKKIEPPKKIKWPKRSTSSASVKAPKFATDLYADLRDRRLLPLVAVMLVAIIAVPFLLVGGDDTNKATAPVVAAAALPARTSFTVVPANSGLRDYHRRLGHRSATSPFSHPVAKRPSESAAATGNSEGGGSSSGGAPEMETSTPGPAPESSTGGESGDKTTTHVVIQKKVLGYEINARAGFLGSIHAQHGIEPNTRLPNRKNPVIVFVGLTDNKKGTLFLMTSSVTAYYGNAHCAVDKQSCQMVELKPGKSVTFAYGYGDARYKLTLRKIVPVVDTREAASTVTSPKGSDISTNGGATAGE
jgi:hypothetical protein